MKSIRNSQFATVPAPELQRSRFDHSYRHVQNVWADLITPIFTAEALPGSTISLGASHFVRLLSPLGRPMLDDLYLETFYFAISLRRLWSHFVNFMGEREYPQDSTEYITPVIKMTGGPTAMNPEMFYDSLGIPPGILTSDAPVKIQAFWQRFYWMIWNEWFRDQNVEGKVAIPLDDGPDEISDALYRSNKPHDYFTSCLPSPQRGDPVSMPLGTIAPVWGNGHGMMLTDGTTDGALWQHPNSLLGADTQTSSGTHVGTIFGSATPFTSGAILGLQEAGTGHDSGLYADLSNATAATINDIRLAFARQRLAERDARGGTRYLEICLAHFSTRPNDQTLQRPEYLGGTVNRINVNQIAQTVPTEVSPMAMLSAFASVSTYDGNVFVKSFDEHCIVLGLCRIRGNVTYQQGVHRMFTRRDKYDYYWPALANIGETPVYNYELFIDNSPADGGVFAYQQAWAEYRYRPDIISGIFRSSHPQSLDFYHLAQEFTDHPTYSADFINSHTPIDRITAVNAPDGNSFLLDSKFDCYATHPMPVMSVPGRLDHA